MIYVCIIIHTSSNTDNHNKYDNNNMACWCFIVAGWLRIRASQLGACAYTCAHWNRCVA